MRALAKKYPRLRHRNAALADAHQIAAGYGVAVVSSAARIVP